MVKNGKLLVISGSAGSGKGAVLKELFNMAEYKYSVSATTREPRVGEVDGVHYHFVTREDFFSRIANGDMLEYVEYSDNFYGTLREPIEKMLSESYSVILEIEVEGALNVKEKFPEAVLIFLSPPTYAELERRLRERGTETEEVIKRRLEISRTESESMSEYDYLVVNGTGEQKKTAFNIHCIAEAEKYKNTLKKDLSREQELIIKTAEENKTDAQKVQKFLKSYFSLI